MPQGIPKDTCPITALLKVVEEAASCEVTV